METGGFPAKMTSAARRRKGMASNKKHWKPVSVPFGEEERKPHSSSEVARAVGRQWACYLQLAAGEGGGEGEQGKADQIWLHCRAIRSPRKSLLLLDTSAGIGQEGKKKTYVNFSHGECVTSQKRNALQQQIIHVSSSNQRRQKRNADRTPSNKNIPPKKNIEMAVG